MSRNDRAQILGAVGRALGTERASREQAQAALVAARIGPPVPPEQVDTFVKRLTALGGRVVPLATADSVLPCLAEQLGGNPQQPRAVATGNDARLDGLDWGKVPALRRVGASACRAGGVTLTIADAGVAETGSLVLVPGQEAPSSLNYLAERHVVLLARSAVVASLEDALALVRRRCAGAVPRAVHLISGPSGTADVALTYVRGAHGPVELLVLLVEQW
jgi:L-lactate dehydrogenase complex protein LldG